MPKASNTPSKNFAPMRKKLPLRRSLENPQWQKGLEGSPYIINIFCRQIEKKIRLSKQEEELKRLMFDATKNKQQFLTRIN